MELKFCVGREGQDEKVSEARFDDGSSIVFLVNSLEFVHVHVGEVLGYKGKVMGDVHKLIKCVVVVTRVSRCRWSYRIRGAASRFLGGFAFIHSWGVICTWNNWVMNLGVAFSAGRLESSVGDFFISNARNYSVYFKSRNWKSTAHPPQWLGRFENKEVKAMLGMKLQCSLLTFLYL